MPIGVVDAQGAADGERENAYCKPFGGPPTLSGTHNQYVCASLLVGRRHRGHWCARFEPIETILRELGWLLGSIVDLHVCNMSFPTCPLSAKASSWVAPGLSWGSLGKVQGILGVTLGVANRAKWNWLLVCAFYMCF